MARGKAQRLNTVFRQYPENSFLLEDDKLQNTLSYAEKSLCIDPYQSVAAHVISTNDDL